MDSNQAKEILLKSLKENPHFDYAYKTTQLNELKVSKIQNAREYLNTYFMTIQNMTYGDIKPRILYQDDKLFQDINSRFLETK